MRPYFRDYLGSEQSLVGAEFAQLHKRWDWCHFEMCFEG